jgi:hypothetical protein
MPKPRTGARFNLGDPVDGELVDFCEAMIGAAHTEVIRRAVSAFIQAELSRNPGIRERYEALRRARREGIGGNVRLIKPDKAC